MTDKMSVAYACPSCGQLAMGPGHCSGCIKRRRYVRVKPVHSLGAVPLSSVQADTRPRLAIPGFPRIESAMNGGFVRGSVTLLYGGAGLGKTTLCLKLTDRITRVHARPSLYCSTEQTPEQIKMAAFRAGVYESPMLVAYDTEVESIVRVLDAVAPPFAVVDSLSYLTLNDPIVIVTGMLVEAARRLDTALLLVLHETKDGDYNAPRQVEHLVDCMVRLHNGADDHMLPMLYWSIMGKYRFGPINRLVRLCLTEEMIPYDPDSPGTTAS